jgi:hypothetical protein
MGDHMHKPGEYMLSYSFMRMDMGGLRDGTNDLSDTEALATGARVIPTDMTMDMHMIGGMAGITDNLTGMIMIPYLDNDMDMRVYNMMGTALQGTSNMKTSGFGDIQISGISNLWENNSQKLNAQIGLSLPTGSTDETDEMLMPSGMSMDMRVPYAMQLGTGTYDILPSLTYIYDREDWLFGAGYKARIHMGRNSEGYSRGNWHELSTWGGYRFSNTIGVGSSLSFKTESEIDGQDDDITGRSPLADPDNYGGEKIHLGLNAGWQFYEMNTVKAEVKLPLYQNVNGVNMEDDYAFMVKFRRTF